MQGPRDLKFEMKSLKRVFTTRGKGVSRVLRGGAGHSGGILEVTCGHYVLMCLGRVGHEIVAIKRAQVVSLFEEAAEVFLLLMLVES